MTLRAKCGWMHSRWVQALTLLLETRTSFPSYFAVLYAGVATSSLRLPLFSINRKPWGNSSQYIRHNDNINKAATNLSLLHVLCSPFNSTFYFVKKSVKSRARCGRTGASCDRTLSDDQQLFSVALLEGYLLLASSLLVTRAFCLRSCKFGTRGNKLPQVFEVTT